MAKTFSLHGAHTICTAKVFDKKSALRKSLMNTKTESYRKSSLSGEFSFVLQPFTASNEIQLFALNAE